MSTRREFLAGGLTVVLGAIAATGCTPAGSQATLTSIADPGSEFLVMVGDSITVGSENALAEMFAAAGYTNSLINAQVGRRIEISGGLLKTSAGKDIVDYLAAADPAPTLWVLALGTNDLGQYAEDADYVDLISLMLAKIPDEAPLVWVNTYTVANEAEAKRFNRLLRTELTVRGNAVVGEWYQQCAKTDGDILSDGIHPSELGVAVFAEVVKTALSEFSS